MEDFLKKNVAKVRYFQRRGVDTKVVDEISVFVKNLSCEIDSSGHLSDFRSDTRTIDNFITRLEKSNDTLQKASFEKRMDWFGITSELTNRLTDAKKSLHLFK